MKKRVFIFIPAAAAGFVLCLAMAGCDEDGAYYREHGSVPVVEETACVVRSHYGVEVDVCGYGGYAVPGAEVELIVAEVPESHYFACADEFGIAYFEIESAPDTTLIVYASAPGYGCGSTDLGLSPECNYLCIPILISPGGY